MLALLITMSLIFFLVSMLRYSRWLRFFVASLLLFRAIKYCVDMLLVSSSVVTTCTAPVFVILYLKTGCLIEIIFVISMATLFLNEFFKGKRMSEINLLPEVFTPPIIFVVATHSSSIWLFAALF